MKEKIDLLQGTLDMLVPKALNLEPLHGLGVSRRIEQITRGAFLSSWGESENNRRAKYYCLTKAGQRQLEAETEDWQRISIAIASALKAT